MDMDNFEKELESIKTPEELEEELLALKLRIAFAKEFQAELAEVEEQLKAPDPELKALMAQSDDRILKLFDREQRKARAKRVVFHFVPKVAHALAIIIAVCSVGLTAAIATVPPVREGVLEFITAMEAKYIALDTDDIAEPVKAPEGWRGEYYPTYIPKGYEFDYTDGKGAWYRSNAGKLLYFKEFDRDTNMNLDSEDAGTKRTEINGNKAFINEKDGWTMIAWMIDDIYFNVHAQCSKTEAMRIAESVELYVQKSN